MATDYSNVQQCSAVISCVGGVLYLAIALIVQLVLI
jgi:hypothetical protein